MREDVIDQANARSHHSHAHAAELSAKSSSHSIDAKDGSSVYPCRRLHEPWPSVGRGRTGELKDTMQAPASRVTKLNKDDPRDVCREHTMGSLQEHSRRLSAPGTGCTLM